MRGYVAVQQTDWVTWKMGGGEARLRALSLPGARAVAKRAARGEGARGTVCVRKLQAASNQIIHLFLLPHTGAPYVLHRRRALRQGPPAVLFGRRRLVRAQPLVCVFFS
jgi:hypothetical protein